MGEGIIAGVTQVCGSDATLGISNAAGVAKEYLNNLPNKCVGACQALPDKAHIDKLDNTFAICAADFFKAYQAKYGPVSMSSTFRCGPKTPTVIQCDRTENGRAGGAGGSNHMLGLAIDVNPLRSSYESMWDFARANPRFGVCFPYLGGDNPHMTLAGSGTGEAAMCARQGVTKPCNGLPFTPITPATNAGIGYSGAPSSGITNALRGLLTAAPYLLQASQQPTQQQPYQQQPLPQTQQPFTYTQSTTYDPTTGTYTTGTSATSGTQTRTTASGNTTVNANSGNNTSGTSLNTLANSASNNSSNSSNTTGQTSGLYLYTQNTNGNASTSGGISALEMIEQLAGYGASTTGVVFTNGTTGPAALNSNVNASNITTQNRTTSSTGTVAITSTSTQLPAYIPTQTFTSNNLRPTDAGPNSALSSYSPQQLSTFQRILTQLRDVLVQVLHYLQPFGGAPRQT